MEAATSDSSSPWQDISRSLPSAFGIIYAPVSSLSSKISLRTSLPHPLIPLCTPTKNPPKCVAFQLYELWQELQRQNSFLNNPNFASSCGIPGFDPWVGKILWRWKWHPTPVLLPGKFHWWRSLVGYSPWGHKETDMTEQLHLRILWHCFSLGLEWKLTFSGPVATAEFSKFAGILSAILSQHHLLGFEIAQLEFHHLH